MSCFDNHIVQLHETAVRVVALLAAVIRLDCKTVGGSRVA